MRRVRRATIGGLAWTLVLCCLVTAGVALGQNAPVAPDRRAVQNRQAAFRKLEKDYAAVKPSALWDFYKKHAPDRIAEFERDCKTSKTKALKTLTEMAERYLDLQAIRQRSEEEYKRMLELVELESEARELGRRVAALAKSSPAAGDVGHKSLLETRKKLRKALEKCFELSQQNELIELNRLEAEVRDLRALLQQRQGARELILQQRFLDVSGTTWEEGK
jgi:hypothetical protein